MRSQRATHFIILVLVLIVPSCKRQESAAGVADGSRAGVSEPGRAASELAAAPPVAGASDTARAGQSTPLALRMIIRNASLSLVVRDASDAVVEATRIAEAKGGYVVETKQWKESSQTRASAVIRVPAATLGPAIEQLRRLAIRVENEAITAQDVSQEHTDLAAQLRNLQAAEVELRALLNSVRQRTQKASDVLEVYTELSRVRGEIEKTEGRLEYLSQMTADSTITLTFTPDALAVPVVEPGWQPLVTVKSAARSLVNSLKFLTDAAIWFLLYLLPIGLVLAGLALLVRFIWRLARRSSGGSDSKAA
jgi:hypothetical protein